eukprot:COSAG02_NODE_1913_length_10405_cov_3.734330_8_plen_478_part_00
MRNEIDTLIAERESTSKHFARLEPECIRYVEKRATKRVILLQSLSVAHPRVYRPPAARAAGGGGRGRGRGARGTQSETRGRSSGSGDRRNGGKGGHSSSSQLHSAVEGSRARRSSVERPLHISTGGSCTWWWRAGSTAGNDVYKPYSDAQSTLLEAAFVAYTNGDDTGKVTLSSEYVVDFATMRQLNARDERKSRPVQRREKQAQDDGKVALPEACPSGQEIAPEPEAEPEPESESPVALPATVPLPTAPTDLEPNATTAAITMGFDATLVERVQADQRAACGSGYEDLHELLPALLAREEEERAGIIPGPPPASESPRPTATPGLPAILSPVQDQPAGVWEWKADRGWKPYSSAQNVHIEAAWKNSGGDSSSNPQQQSLQGHIVLEGGTHAIDFAKMRQVKVGDEKRSRPVRRREEPVAPASFAPPGVANVLSPRRPMTPPVVGQGDGSQISGGESLAVWEWKACVAYRLCLLSSS